VKNDMSGRLVDDRRERIQKMHNDAIGETEFLIKQFEEENHTEKGYALVQLFDQTVWINSEKFLADCGFDTGLRPQVLNGYFDLLMKSGRFVKNPKNSKYFRANFAEQYKQKLYNETANKPTET
jgi:hypothetical protein